MGNGARAFERSEADLLLHAALEVFGVDAAESGARRKHTEKLTTLNGLRFITGEAMWVIKVGEISVTVNMIKVSGSSQQHPSVSG